MSMVTRRRQNSLNDNGTTLLAERLDLFRLRVFNTVVNEGTMSRAGQRLFITQPAVSAHIKALENDFGVRLFDRVGRRAVVNSAGHVLYEKAQRLLTVAEDLKAAMSELQGVDTGTLRIGASVTWQYHLSGPLSKFKKKFPHVEPVIQIGNSEAVERMVVDRSVDIGLIARIATHPELRSIEVAKDEVIAICAPSHPLASANGSTSQGLQDAEFIVREPGSATREATERMLSSNGTARNYSMELGSVEAIKQMVLSGSAIGFVSLGAVKMDISMGMLSPVPGASAHAVINLCAIVAKHATLGRWQQVFLDVVSDCADA